MKFTPAEIVLPFHLRPNVPMDDAELLRFCAANEGLQVERYPSGEILVMTPAGFNSSKINHRIGWALGAWAHADGRGVATESSGGYSLPDGSMRAPDAAWVTKHRIDSLSEAERQGFPPLCPEFVIELRSPSDSLTQLQAKMDSWIANGAEQAWLIDPIERTVSIYRPGAVKSPEIEKFFDPTSVQGSGVIAGFELVMAMIWD